MNQKKFIFLDVDGVLNCMPYCDRTGRELNPENIRRLKEIVDATDAEIVLSSTWKRIWHDESVGSKHQKEMLVSSLGQYGLSIAALTPDSKKGNRPEEIHTFLIEYARMHPEETIFYVILDDDYKKEHFEPYFLENHLVSTKFFCQAEEEGGLQDCHVQKAICILNGEGEPTMKKCKIIMTCKIKEDDIEEIFNHFIENYPEVELVEDENSPYNPGIYEKLDNGFMKFEWNGTVKDGGEDEIIRLTHHAEGIYGETSAEYVHVEVCIDGKWYGAA